MNYMRKTVKVVCLMIFCLIIIDQIALAADRNNAAHYKLTEIQRGTVSIETKVNVRKAADKNSDRIGQMEPGESCKIIDEEGDWWRVQFGGKTGYVLKELLTVSMVQEDEEYYIAEPLEAFISDLKAPTLLQYRNEYVLKGTVESNLPLVSVTVEIFNERTLETERTSTVTMKHEEYVRQYALEEMEDDLSFYKLDPGEKTLIISLADQWESRVLAEIPFYVKGEVYEDSNGISINPYSDAVHMTEDCDIKVSKGNSASMLDNNYRTEWEFPSSEDKITIELPEGRMAELMTIHWSTAPNHVSIEIFDENGETLSVILEENPNGRIHFSYEIDEAARTICISTTDEEIAICELRVYEKDKVSQVVQQWEEIPDKVDIMIISTHQDDELLFFGGTIPYYAAQGKNVAVVYMANCSRRRYAEALDGLWSCGLKTHPVFLGLRDAKLESYRETTELWGEQTTIDALVDLFRKYQPDVIVTHDVNGEYGHNQHKLTSACVQKAVVQAGDATISSESAEQYGVWTPKKLYIHLYEDDEVIMEQYDDPVEEQGYMSMTQIATIGYSKHVSQQEFYSMERHGVRYDNRKYGLAFTTVGNDVEKNDFFENID